MSFSEDADAEVRLANGILVVSFKQPVDLNVDRLPVQVPGYVSAARRDPDGSAIRIALTRKVRINSLAAGERLFLDLLPEDWAGLPPGLPKDVVEDLSRRAREAERKLRQQDQKRRERAGEGAAGGAVRVRVSLLPTLVRYTFPLPETVTVEADRNDESFDLAFNARLTFDLAEARADLPSTLSGIEVQPGENATKVRFALAGSVEVRSFREPDGFVVDVSPAGARDRTLLSDVPKSAGPDGKSTSPKPEESASPIGAPAGSGKTRLPIPAKVGSAKPTAETPSRAAPQPDARPALPVAEPPRTEAKPGPAAAPEQGRAAPVSAQPGDPPPADQTVVAQARRQGEALRLVFPFHVATPAAVFRRRETLWLVFDSTTPVDVAGLREDPTHTIRSATLGRLGDAQVVRIKLERTRLATLSAEGAALSVTLGEAALEPTAPLAIERRRGAGQSSAVIAFERPHAAHRIADPDTGESLIVVSAFAPARGFVRDQDFVDFRVLASVHGVAIEPVADDLTAEIEADRIVLARPEGLTLTSGSAPGATAQGSFGFRPVLLDEQAWGFDRQANFLDRRATLTASIGDAQEGKRTAARTELARFYLARGMFHEAKGVLETALGAERDNF